MAAADLFLNESCTPEADEFVPFHKIARILRLVENRRCADCSVVLGGDGKSAYAQVGFGVWVCKKCAEIHNRFVSSEGLFLALSRWSTANFDKMVAAGSNLKRNKVLERYSNGLTKAQPDASNDERELWIRCKYKYMLAIPAMSEKEQLQKMGLDNEDKKKNSSAPPKKPAKPNHTLAASSASIQDVGKTYESLSKNVLPMRLVDFFITFGPGAFVPNRKSDQGFTKVVDIKRNSDSGSKITGSATLSLERKIISAESSTKDKDLRHGIPFLPANCNDMILPATVDNCFPDADTYSDSALPEVSAPFVFPSGLYLSGEDKPPSLFTFVLTDGNRVKIYGTALIFHELLHPDDVLRLVTPLPDAKATYTYNEALALRKEELASSRGWDIVYAPRAIVLIGHYPFFSAFSEFLKDIYRTSLSAAPVPIERFVNNFIVETPLPPLGCVEVCVTLPSRTLSLTRPPINRLPMCDFSYRPLFACLSVDNIITTFRMLCGEYSVCFVSRNISLLTPVQEAMLSFLYPLVWQGVYIPILPSKMFEILDAPVPIVTGIQDSYIKDIPSNRRPSAVLYVNIDDDTLYLGKTKLDQHPFPSLADQFDYSGYDDARNEIISFLQEPLPKMFVKLRQKMSEFGGCIYQSKTSQSMLESSFLAFPKGEYMTPLSIFAMETGSRGKDFTSKGSDRFSRQAATLSHCSDDLDTKESIFNPSNNCANEPGQKWDNLDNFDASELRFAFLRFFVALFIETGSAQEELDRVLSQGIAGRQSVASSRIGSRITTPVRLEPFYLNLLGTQMYSEFKDERQFNSEMPEIRYFEESIAAKKNRSRFTFSAQSTPFLDSHAGDIVETYTPPMPSVSGLDVGKQFEYSRWPLLNAKNLGPTRPLQLLLKEGAEKMRKANKLQTKSGYNVFQENLLEHISNDSAISSSKITNNPGEDSSKRLDYVLNEGCRRYQSVCSAISIIQANFRMKKQVKIWLVIHDAIIRIQSTYRAYDCSKKVGGMRVLFHLKEKLGYVIRIQSAVRALTARRIYRKIYRLVLWVQATVRAGDTRARYKTTRHNLHLLTALCRGFLTRKCDERRRAVLFIKYRRQLLLLWKLELTNLQYRSLFWVMIRMPSYLHLAMLRDELFRLYKSTGLLDTIMHTKEMRGIQLAHGIKNMKNTHIRGGTSIDGLLDRANENRMKKIMQTANSVYVIEVMETSPIWKLVVANEGSSTGKDDLATQLGNTFAEQTLKRISDDKSQRDKIYKAMKQNISTSELNDFYSWFGLSADAKRKKDTVIYKMLFNDSESVLKLCGLDPVQIIDASASLIMHIDYNNDKNPNRNGVLGLGWIFARASEVPSVNLDICSPTSFDATSRNNSWIDDWFQKKKAERIRAASLETLRVCLHIIARKKQ